MSQNYSGFGGYSFANIYPQWGDGVSQREETSPEPTEQQAYSTAEQINAAAPVDKKVSTNIWYVVGMAVVLILFFGTGK